MVYASTEDMGAITSKSRNEPWFDGLGAIVSLGFGLLWQRGVLGIQLKRNDIVVLSGAPNYLTNIILLLKCKLCGVKTIWWGHYRSSSSKGWTTALRLALARLSSALLFYTDKEIETYLNKNGQNGAPIFSLNNGLETSRIKSLRSAYVSEHRNNHIFFIGRLSEKSNFALLLDAVAQLSQLGIVLEVVGDCEDSKLASLKRFAEERKIAERIIWHGGIIDEREIAAIANRCRLFVYPGEVGLSLIHGMAYGLPALVHGEYSRHMPEIAAFVDGDTGRTFVNGDSVSLTNRLRELLRSPESLNEMSVNATRTVDETYNAADMTERFIDMVSKMDPHFEG